MFEVYAQNKEIQEFLKQAALWELAYRFQDLMDIYDMRDISLESFGPLDRGVVVLSVGTKDTIIVTQRIDAEAASTMRKAALASATEDELLNLLAFLKKAKIVAYNEQLKEWIESCISTTKVTLREKL